MRTGKEEHTARSNNKTRGARKLIKKRAVRKTSVNECRQKARACCKREETKRSALIFMGQKRQMRLTSVWCQRVVNTLLALQMCKQINSPPSHAALHSWSAKSRSPLVSEETTSWAQLLPVFAGFVCRWRVWCARWHLTVDQCLSLVKATESRTLRFNQGAGPTLQQTFRGDQDDLKWFTRHGKHKNNL